MQVLVVREKGLMTNTMTKVDAIAWWIDSGATTHVCKDRHVHYRRMLEMSKDDLIPTIDENTEKCGNKKYVITFIDDAPRAVVRLPDSKRKILSEKGIDCIFVGYAKYFKAYRFYVIEPNDFVSINTLIKSRDAIFDENRFSSIPRPKDIIPNSKESQKDEHSNDVPSETPEPRKVDKTKKFSSSKFSMQDMREEDVILGIKIKRENKGIVITQSRYIKKILKKFNRKDCSSVSTPMDPVEKLMPNTVGRLSRFTSNPSRQHWHAIPRVFKYIFYNGWVFLLGGGVISWASKKQTCITGSAIESEFVALVAAGKEVEWLRNLIHEIPI
ncbi:zinc finger, CCHC-type containing protein [Tanacetum coccineum]